MGTRASLSLMTIEEWNRCLETSSTDLYEINPVSESMAYDFCTDAAMDSFRQGKVKRLTMTELSCESDIWLGVMDKDNFKDFIRNIASYAKRFPFCENSTDYVISNLDRDKDKCVFLYDTTWHGAYYSAMNIYKNVDWAKYIIYIEIG